MGYILVDDVDGMAVRMQAEGGKLHKGPITVPGIIRFAVVADPQGADFLIATPLSRSRRRLCRRHARHDRLARTLCRGWKSAFRLLRKAVRLEQRPGSWIWARWAPISCSRPAANMRRAA